jgi:hypothetical protein
LVPGSDAHMFNIAGHALVGCASSVAQGGRCGPGALSGGLGSLVGPYMRDHRFGFRVVSNAVLGGVVSAAAGGNFGNGALTAAFGYLFNELGALPPAPPGYDPATWRYAPFDLEEGVRHRLIDPEGRWWIAHPEDEAHWRHWDVRDDPDDPSGGQSRWPEDSKKPWPNQRRAPYGGQSGTDPSGDAPGWQPPLQLRDIIPGLTPGGTQFPITPGAKLPIIRPVPVIPW